MINKTILREKAAEFLDEVYGHRFIDLPKTTAISLDYATEAIVESSIQFSKKFLCWVYEQEYVDVYDEEAAWKKSGEKQIETVDSLFEKYINYLSKL